MDIVKTIFSNRLLINSRWYRASTIKAAKRHAQKYPNGEMGVSIETTLNCNAKCVMCFHGYKQLSGVMSMDLFKKIIDDCNANHITNVGLSVYGEPLTDPYLFERIGYLRKYNMGYGFITNGYLLDADKAEMLFKLGGFRKINFSACGYEPHVYESIMVNLKRDVTYKNIINFLHLKLKYKQNNLIVIISTVKLNLNKGEMKDFVKFWQRQKGVNQIITADLWDRVGSKNVNELGEIGKIHKSNNWLAPCKQLWGGVYIYFDGRVAPCCDDGDLRKLIIGDINKQDLRQIYSGDYIKNLRKQHFEDKRYLHPICGKCYHNQIWF